MDNKEFDIFITGRRDHILRLCRSILCKGEEALDAAQDILEKLWRRRETIPVSTLSEAWLYTVTRNHCLDRLRGRRITTDPLPHQAPSTDGNRRIELRDTHRLIEEIMAQLPEKQRTAMHLRDVEGFQFAEIAEITGSDETSVRMNLSRARKTVREQLIKAMEKGLAVR